MSIVAARQAEVSYGNLVHGCKTLPLPYSIPPYRSPIWSANGDFLAYRDYLLLRLRAYKYSYLLTFLLTDEFLVNKYLYDTMLCI